MCWGCYLAKLCGVGSRFISDVENGKSTIELGKVLHVLQCLGLEVAISPRTWQANLQAKLSAEATVSSTKAADK